MKWFGFSNHNFNVYLLQLQEAMYSQGSISPGTKEESGRKPQDVLSYEGYHVPFT